MTPQTPEQIAGKAGGMTDKHTLVERLEAWADSGDFGRGPDPTDLRRLAATRITALEAEKTELVDALLPFANWAEYGPSREYIKGAEDHGLPANTPHTAGDYRRAATLAKARQSDEGE